MIKRSTQLEAEKVNVENEIDTLDQYSIRNCVLVHGMPASDDAEYALINLFGRTLGGPVGRDDIDHCHGLGASVNDT